MVQLGEHERLRETRMFFRYASVREFCAPVEQATGRKVRAFISGIDTEADGPATEVFVLVGLLTSRGRTSVFLYFGPRQAPVRSALMKTAAIFFYPTLCAA